jgi:hypothetical protein
MISTKTKVRMPQLSIDRKQLLMRWSFVTMGAEAVLNIPLTTTPSA